MRAIDSLSSSSSLRVGLLFAFLMLLAALFLVYGIWTGNAELPIGDHRTSTLKNVLGWALVLFLALSAIASLWIGYYVFSRINRIADAAGTIMSSGDLASRLPIDSSWDDLSKLAVVLNRMLGEIEQLIGSVRSVSDDIAHDLRSPLTRLKTQIERVDDPTMRASLRNEVDGILNMFNALLRIAEIETEKQKQAFSMMRLDYLLHDAIELYRPLADAKAMTISADLGECHVFGDRDLLFQAFSNILDNAIKFSPEGSRIAISARDEHDATLVEVADSGIGIPDRHKEEATKRFFRVDESRSTPGHGLGLAMVAAIVRRHGGLLSLHDVDDHREWPGLRCRLRFPAHGDHSMIDDARSSSASLAVRASSP